MNNNSVGWMNHLSDLIFLKWYASMFLLYNIQTLYEYVSKIWEFPHLLSSRSQFF